MWSQNNENRTRLLSFSSPPPAPHARSSARSTVLMARVYRAITGGDGTTTEFGIERKRHRQPVQPHNQELTASASPVRDRLS